MRVDGFVSGFRRVKGAVVDMQGSHPSTGIRCRSADGYVVPAESPECRIVHFDVFACVDERDRVAQSRQVIVLECAVPD